MPTHKKKRSETVAPTFRELEERLAYYQERLGASSSTGEIHLYKHKIWGVMNAIANLKRKGLVKDETTL